MRSERPLHLDVEVPFEHSFSASGEAAGHADARSQQQLADDSRALRALLEQQHGTQAPAKAATASTASPFDLFLASPAATDTHPPTTAPMASPAALAQTLQQMARRLLVGDGRSGQRGVQIQLDDALLPGVIVDVLEASGRLVTRFTCSHEGSRERLTNSACWLADSLARCLRRDTRVEVQTDDPEDPRLLQVDANH